MVNEVLSGRRKNMQEIVYTSNFPPVWWIHLLQVDLLQAAR